MEKRALHGVRTEREGSGSLCRCGEYGCDRVMMLMPTRREAVIAWVLFVGAWLLVLGVIAMVAAGLVLLVSR
jgi:hypothetical protein